MATNIDNLANQITEQLKAYAQITDQQVQEIAENVAEEGARELKTAGNFKDATGDYRKGWEAIKVNRNWVVRNRTNYQLTHLLEKGHAKVNGGRTRKFRHIKPVEQKLITEFEKRIRERLT